MRKETSFAEKKVSNKILLYVEKRKEREKERKREREKRKDRETEIERETLKDRETEIEREKIERERQKKNLIADKCFVIIFFHSHISYL